MTILDELASYARYRTEEAKKKLSPEMQKSLASVLKEDPRPAYQQDPDRVYGFLFAGKNIRFRVKDGEVTVVEIQHQ